MTNYEIFGTIGLVIVAIGFAYIALSSVKNASYKNLTK